MNVTCQVWGPTITPFKLFQNILAVIVSFKILSFQSWSIVLIARTRLDDHLCLPCCFTISFWRQVY